MKPGLLPMMLLRRSYATIAFTLPVFPSSKTMVKIGPDDSTLAAVGLSSKTMAKIGPSSVTMGVP